MSTERRLPIPRALWQQLRDVLRAGTTGRLEFDLKAGTVVALRVQTQEQTQERGDTR